MTTTAPRSARDLPAGTHPVRPGGLLQSVARTCPAHGAPMRCVARDESSACLVYWCPAGAHHVTAGEAASR